MRNKKEVVTNVVKVLLLFAIMINGIFHVYALIWGAVGLPLTNCATFMLFVFACLTEYGYCRWLME